MYLLIILILLVFMLGGGGYYGYANYGPTGGLSVGGIILVLILLWIFFGHNLRI